MERTLAELSIEQRWQPGGGGLAWLACGALFLAACHCDGGGPSDAGGHLPPAPVNATVILETGRSATAMIDLATGGELSATSAKSTAFTLRIPPQEGQSGKLQISLTPAGELRGLPAGLAFVAGAQLQPEGLLLRPAAALIVTPPAALATEDLFAFGYEQSGEDFHMVPHVGWPATTSQAELSVVHFSGTGIGSGAGLAAGISPASVAAQVEQAVAILVDEARAKDVIPAYDAQTRSDFSAVMKTAFDSWVRLALEDARVKVEASLAQPCSVPQPAPLDATNLAVHAVLLWAAGLGQWAQWVFPPFNDPPSSWPYARSQRAWSGYYQDIGLDPQLDSDLTFAANALSTDFEKGTQDEACSNLTGAEVCKRYECLEVAMSWASELGRTSAMQLTPSAVIDAIDINAYCGGIWDTYVREIVVGPSEATLAVGESKEFLAVAVNAAGADLDPQPTLTWETTDPSVATVDASGVVTAVGPGWSGLVVKTPHDCRSARADIYVSPTAFTIEGTSPVQCSGSNSCGCGNRGTPPMCTDLDWTRTGTLTVGVWMHSDQQMGFTATADYRLDKICANGEDPTSDSTTYHWDYSGQPWDDSANLIEAWQLGTPGYTHFNYGASRDTENTYNPIHFHGEFSPVGPSAAILVENDPVCHQTVPIDLH